jgi:hypothetical protein
MRFHYRQRKVSEVIGKMSFLWLPIGDEPGPNSQRGYIERNVIALLSNANARAVLTAWLPTGRSHGQAGIPRPPVGDRRGPLVGFRSNYGTLLGLVAASLPLPNEGYRHPPEILAHLSLYKTGHINRFEHYELRFDQIPPPMIEDLRLAMASPLRREWLTLRVHFSFSSLDICQTLRLSQATFYRYVALGRRATEELG